MSADKRSPKRKAVTRPPEHGGEEVKLRLSIDEPQAVYVAGVWVSPGEEAFVPAAEALIEEGKAVAIDA